MVSLARKLQILAFGTPSHHDKLFNEHGYSKIGATYLKGNVTHNYFGKPGSKQDVAGINKKLRAQGYKHKKSAQDHTWTKGKHTVSYNGTTRELNHSHPDVDTLANEANGDIINLAKGIIAALEGDLTYPKTAIENAKSIIRAIKGQGDHNDNVGAKPTMK